VGKADTALHFVPVNDPADQESETHGQHWVHRSVAVSNSHEAEGGRAGAKDRAEHVQSVIQARNLVGDEFDRHQPQEKEDSAQGGNEIERPIEKIAIRDPVGQSEDEKGGERVPAAGCGETNSSEYSRVQGFFLTRAAMPPSEIMPQGPAGRRRPSSLIG
jgi:hypothetical protein